MKNRYLRRSHISESKFRVIVREFCRERSVDEIVEITRISRVSICRVTRKIRERIVLLCEADDSFEGEVEVDESYFGARRVRGKRGRGAKGKIPVVGLLKRNGKVYCKVIKSCKKEELMPVIKGKILEESTVYTDGWKSYDGLVLNGYKHYRVYHSKDEFVRGKSHVNGIESFWSFTKRRLTRMNGVRKDKFLLHLKESEFRWNNRDKQKMYRLLLRSFRYSPL